MQRVNKENLLVVVYTEKEDVLEKFSSLPFAKKCCFVPFFGDNNVAAYIPRILAEERLFGALVNGIATEQYPCFDLWKLLLEGCVVPRMLWDEQAGGS